MHQADESDWTNVVFGVLSDRVDVAINPVSLSVLRSSLIELFLQQSNLTLTNSIFGEPSSLEILKSPGGITVIPDQSASIWQISQTLFNFTLHNSICEVIENLSDLKKQLKSGLRLRSYEVFYLTSFFCFCPVYVICTTVLLLKNPEGLQNCTNGVTKNKRK